MNAGLFIYFLANINMDLYTILIHNGYDRVHTTSQHSEDIFFSVSLVKLCLIISEMYHFTKLK